jgi:hypothetical protein
MENAKDPEFTMVTEIMNPSNSPGSYELTGYLKKWLARHRAGSSIRHQTFSCFVFHFVHRFLLAAEQTGRYYQSICF